jgi:hypothetical protein
VSTWSAAGQWKTVGCRVSRGLNGKGLVGVGHVEVDIAAVMAVARGCGLEPLWLRLRSPEAGLAEMRDAVGLATEELETIGGEYAEIPEYVWASDSLVGPLIGLRVGEEHDRTELWVTTFVKHLEAAGHSGLLDTVRQASRPRWPETAPDVLLCYAAYTYDPGLMLGDPDRDRHWLVAPVATAAIAAAAVGWMVTPGASTLFTQDGFTLDLGQATDEELASIVARTLALTPMPSLQRFNERTHLKRMVKMGPGAEAAYMHRSDTLGWAGQVASLREIATALPHLTEQAFIRPGRAIWGSWIDFESDELPGTTESLTRYNKHLLSAYVPDAHGFQVLRQAHLDNARDLGEWSVTPVGDDRYVVEYRDLDEWYTPPRPPGELIAQARADFGGMILTPAIADAHPPAWDRPSPWIKSWP